MIVLFVNKGLYITALIEKINSQINAHPYIYAKMRYRLAHEFTHTYKSADTLSFMKDTCLICKFIKECW